MKTSKLPTFHRGEKKHHPLTIALHWGTLLCIAIAVAAVLGREVVGDKYWRMVLLETHRQLGLVVLLAVAARLYVRQRHGLANHMHGLPLAMRMAATACHWLLYALLVGLPLLGWACTNAHNVGLRFMGVLALPALVNVDSELADTLSDYHILGAWFLLGTVTLHAGAALFHHFIRRDSVLWAMLPERSSALPVLHSGPQQTRHGATE